MVGGHVKKDIYCPKCKESRVFSCEMIPYYWYNDRKQEIERRTLEEEIVSWQQIQNMRTPQLIDELETNKIK